MPRPLLPDIGSTLLQGWDAMDLAGLADGVTVTSWMDVTGLHELTPLGGTGPEVDLNSSPLGTLPGAKFVGPERLGVTAESMNVCTFFFVVRNPPNDGTIKNMVTANGYLLTTKWSTASRWVFGLSQFSFIEFTDAALVGAHCQWTYVHRGTGSLVRTNGTQRVSGTVGSATTSAFWLGDEGGGQAGFTMHEVLVYDGIVSPADIDIIEDYLQAKWFEPWSESVPPSFNATASGQFVHLNVQAEGAESVTITRRTYDNREIRVRGVVDAPIVSDGFIGYDYEAPQGRELTYTAYIKYPTDEEVILFDDAGIVDYGGDYIMPVGRWEFGMNLFVEWDGISGKEHSMIQDTVPVLGRKGPVSVSWGRLMPRGSISFLTMEDFDRRNFLRIIEYPVIMFVARPDFGYDDPVFLSLEVVTEERTIGYGGESSRRWICDVQEVDRPPATYVLPVLAIPWQSVLDGYGDWQAVLDTGNNWYQIAGYP
jgi:hypothetical protein